MKKINNINRKTGHLYLELMKKTLSFLLWPEPYEPITMLNSRRSFIKNKLISSISTILARIQLLIVYKRNSSIKQRIEGQISPIYADTMIGLKRLDNLQKCVETVIEENIEGDFIETGAWRGGACIFMRAILAVHEIEDRKIFVADSFEGLPKPNTNYSQDSEDKHYMNTYLAVSKEEVKNNFQKYGLLDKQVVFLEGWFEDTLPNAPIDKLSILRLDGDMYGSTIESLNNLYPKLSKGGYCIIDDYALSGCKSAVDDFRLNHNIKSKIKKIDWTGIYWKK